jgi:hypothetical protein
VSTNTAAATWPSAPTPAAAAAAAGVVAPATVQAEGQGPIRLTAAAVQSWYTKAASAYERYGVEPPVYPGQCVPCPEGSVQSGAACKCCFWGECCARVDRVCLVVRVRLCASASKRVRLCASASKSPMALSSEALLQ